MLQVNKVAEPSSKVRIAGHLTEVVGGNTMIDPSIRLASGATADGICGRDTCEDSIAGCDRGMLS